MNETLTMQTICITGYNTGKTPSSNGTNENGTTDFGKMMNAAMQPSTKTTAKESMKSLINGKSYENSGNNDDDDNSMGGLMASAFLAQPEKEIVNVDKNLDAINIIDETGADESVYVTQEGDDVTIDESTLLSLTEKLNAILQDISSEILSEKSQNLENSKFDANSTDINLLTNKLNPKDNISKASFDEVVQSLKNFENSDKNTEQIINTFNFVQTKINVKIIAMSVLKIGLTPEEIQAFAKLFNIDLSQTLSSEKSTFVSMLQNTFGIFEMTNTENSGFVFQNAASADATPEMLTQNGTGANSENVLNEFDIENLELIQEESDGIKFIKTQNSESSENLNAKLPSEHGLLKTLKLTSNVFENTQNSQDTAQTATLTQVEMLNTDTEITETVHIKDLYFPQKIADEILQKTQDGIQKFDIQLAPKALGKINISIIMEAGKVMINMICENEKAQILLSAHANSIRHIMEENTGFKTIVNAEQDENPYGKPDDYDGHNGGNQQEQNKKQPSKDQVVSFVNQLKFNMLEAV